MTTVAPPQTSTEATPRTPAVGEPVWPLAEMLFPRQGDWTEEQYLKLDLMRTELVDGRLEFIPVGDENHQNIVYFFLTLLKSLLQPSPGVKKGVVMFAPFKMKTVPGNIREPDVEVMLAENFSRRSKGSWKGADLAIEVVSPDDPNRDYEDKRQEYAAAGVREYWIVDPMKRTILLLVLEGSEYRESVRATATDDVVLESGVVEGFNVRPADVFAAAEE